MNNFLVTLLLMYFGLFGMNVQDFTPIYSVQEGVNEINSVFPDWVENYEDDEFDCSEMSALVAQYFIIHGYQDVKIKYGYNKDIGCHAWVVVDGQIIEATSLYISDDIEFYNSFVDRGSRQLYTENDWWNSKYIQDKMGDKFTLYLVSKSVLMNNVIN